MNRIILTISLLIAVAASQAAMWNVTATMSGLNEVPPNTSPASGTFSATYDDVTNQMTNGTGTVTGITSGISASHIHQAVAGVNGGVVFGLGTWVGGPPNYTLTMPGTFGTLTAAQETALFASGLYINVHSQAFPGGEIRDQLRFTPVPEPASMAALGLGLAAIVRKRKAR